MAQCLTCVMGDRAQVGESFEHRVRGGERHWCGEDFRSGTDRRDDVLFLLVMDFSRLLFSRDDWPPSRANLAAHEIGWYLASTASTPNRAQPGRSSQRRRGKRRREKDRSSNQFLLAPHGSECRPVCRRSHRPDQSAADPRGDVLRGAAPVDRLSGAPILDPGNGGAAAYEAGDQKAGSSQRIARKVECRSGDAGECPADPGGLHVNRAGGVFVNPDTRPGWADRWMTAIGHPSFSGCRYTTLAGRLQ